MNDNKKGGNVKNILTLKFGKMKRTNFCIHLSKTFCGEIVPPFPFARCPCSRSYACNKRRAPGARGLMDGSRSPAEFSEFLAADVSLIDFNDML